MEHRQSTALAGNRSRRIPACDECKRRKVRCSAEPICSNCRRDAKICNYSSPAYRIVALERQNDTYSRRLKTFEELWSIHVPDVPLCDAFNRLSTDQSALTQQETSRPAEEKHSIEPDQAHSPSSAEHEVPEATNAEELEFDESEDPNRQGEVPFIAAITNVGYNGPFSSKLLKVLQALPVGSRIDDSHTLASPSSQGNATIRSVQPLIDDYFAYFHPSYPLLHEGLFRARYAGAVAKPRDGSWPLLLNSVLAMGAFVGRAATSDDEIDVHYYHQAKSSISLSVIEKGSLSYVQGLTILANYLQKKDKPNAGFALIGIAWSMGMAIGLHREFGVDGTNVHTMEMRRRTWWTLFVCVSEAQLILGRPPASLIGVNLSLPVNADDEALAVDIPQLPADADRPTVCTCLIQHIKLAKIANGVQAQLLSPSSSASRNKDLRQQIGVWHQQLPPYFDESTAFDQTFELSKRMVLWRAYHLRIILDRVNLFYAIDRGQELLSNHAAMQCIEAANQCIDSISQFLAVSSAWRFGFAWYAAYWAMSASFIHAVCFACDKDKDNWAARLSIGVRILEQIGPAYTMARRARAIFEQILATRSQPQTEDMSSFILNDDMLANFPIHFFGLPNNDLGGFGSLEYADQPFEATTAW